MNKIHWRHRFLPEQKSVCGCGEVQLFILIYVCLHFIYGIHFTLNVFPAQSKSSFILYSLTLLERFSYDLETKTREQNRNNKRTEIERFDWFVERIQTRVASGRLSERSGEKTSCPRTF